MENKIKYISFLMFIVLHFSINAQDALTAEVWDATTESQCVDGIIELQINDGFPPYDIEWSNGETTQNITNLSSGSYTVTVTDALCGTAELTVDVGCEDCPALIIGVQHYGFIECEGKKGKLTVLTTDDGAPPYSYEWSNGETTQTIENLDPGYYYITVTDERGCESSMGMNLYIVNPAIQLFEYEDLLVQDNCKTTPPNGSVTFFQSFGAGYKYFWTGPNGYHSNSENIYNLNAGEYCVEVRPFSNLDCIYAKGCATIELTSPPQIKLINKQNIPICKGDFPPCIGSLTISVPSGTTVEWSPLLPNPSQQFSTNITDLCKGSYTVTAYNNDGCSASRTFTIDCCHTIDPNDSNDEFTEPISVTGEVNSYNGSIVLTVSGGGNQIYYIWSGPNGFTSSLKNLSGLTAGIYCVKVFDGCSEDNECFEIIDCNANPINIHGNVTNTCRGYSFGSISISASGGSGSPYTYNWNNGSSSSTLDNLAIGEYCVTVTDKSGCQNTNCFTVGANVQQDVTESTIPCGWQYSCNGHNTNFVYYDGEPNCYYDDPFDCTRVNCYCPVTGGYLYGYNNSYLQLSYDWNRCILWGLCPNGSGWDVAQYGSTQSWYQYVQVCNNCWQCYYIEICILNGYYQVIQAYAVGDSNCGGKGPGDDRINDEENPLSLISPIRLNELEYILRRDSLVDSTSIMLIPEGLSDTLFIEDYTDLFASIRLKSDTISVYEFEKSKQLTEIDCSKKDCGNKTGEGLRFNSNIDIADFKNDVRIFPNPFNNELLINLNNLDITNSKITVEISSIVGQTMIVNTINTFKHTIETSKLSEGVYICTIRKEKEIINIQKIIKL